MEKKQKQKKKRKKKHTYGMAVTLRKYDVTSYVLSYLDIGGKTNFTSIQDTYSVQNL